MIRGAIIVWLVIQFASSAMAVESSSRLHTYRWCYECSVLCLGSVASLQLTVEPSEVPHAYRIILQGKASGLVGWLSGDRHQYYESLVRLNTNDTVTTLFHLHQTDITHNSQRIKYGWKFTFSELSLAVNGERLWGGSVVETAQYCTEYDVPNSTRVVGDFLSALFVFIEDRSQPLEVGLQYRFLVFYRDDYVDLNIDVIDYHEKYRWQCRVRSDSSCLPGGGNEMLFYCDDNRVPLTGVSQTIFGGLRVYGSRCVGE